jgi:glycosyltransferase involved in cell wall biosynthesis
MYDLTVVIATHNRALLAVEAIESVLKQNFKDFYFVLSDNSDNNDTLGQLEVRSLLDKLQYIKRPNITPLDHFNIILDEAKTKYLILFHDDDIMLPDMVGTLYKEINNNGKIVAVGSSAYCKMGSKFYGKYFKIKNDKLLSTKLNLIEKYYDNHTAAFPSYIYNVDLIKRNNVCFSDKAGKYSDVVWLLELMDCGKIKWLVKKLMIYRLHRGQDSAKINIYDNQKLINYYSVILGIGRRVKIIRKYRLLNLYYIMINRLTRNRRMTLYLFKQLVFLFKNKEDIIIKYPLKYCVHIINIYFIKLFKIDILLFLKEGRRR